MQEIIDKFSDEAAFLWCQRARAVRAPHFTLADLTRLDERLEAHVDGLRVAEAGGWAGAPKDLACEGPDSLFAPALLALGSGAGDRFKAVLENVEKTPTNASGLISALAWLPFTQVQEPIRDLLAATAPWQRHIGLRASALHRRDPGRALDQALADSDPILLARALRAVGELGGCEGRHRALLRDHFSANDEAVRFAAIWSTGLNGDPQALEFLPDFVSPASPGAEAALHLTLAQLPLAQARTWQQQLAEKPATRRLAVMAVGLLGDPTLVPWLIDRMREPTLARIAGEAFALLTGQELDHPPLLGHSPADYCAGPSDDPRDHHVDPDADADRPWPDPQAVADWWNCHQQSFAVGIRHVLGLPLSAPALRRALINGRQIQRAAAAVERTLLLPGTPLFPVMASACRQIQEIDKL